MIKYYDIHTHQYTSASANSVSIHSLSQDEIVKGLESNTCNLYYSCGIHPWHIANTKITIVDICKLVASNNKIVAIGECGLDKLIDTPMEIQKQVFSQQIELAAKLKLPLIIHCVKAWDQLLELHQKYQPLNPWILHGFRGQKQQAEQLTKFGFYFSIGEHFNKEALSIIKSNRLFLETDNSSLPIQDIYAKVATALSFKKEDLGQNTEQNVRAVFDL